MFINKCVILKQGRITQLNDALYLWIVVSVLQI